MINRLTATAVTATCYENILHSVANPDFFCSARPQTFHHKLLHSSYAGMKGQPMLNTSTDVLLVAHV